MIQALLKLICIVAGIAICGVAGGLAFSLAFVQTPGDLSQNILWYVLLSGLPGTIFGALGGGVIGLDVGRRLFGD
ncbi:MAG: hypothetical protein QM775_15375 [Pirellulales bacterium]